jgi:hypothetical protein
MSAATSVVVSRCLTVRAGIGVVIMLTVRSTVGVVEATDWLGALEWPIVSFQLV